MPCLIGCLALFTPRMLLFCFLFFSNYVQSAFRYWLWPWVGLFFMPLTTLAYAWAIHSHGGVEGSGFVAVLIAVLLDLGVVGFRPKPWWVKRLSNPPPR